MYLSKIGFLRMPKFIRIQMGATFECSADRERSITRVVLLSIRNDQLDRHTYLETQEHELRKPMEHIDLSSGRMCQVLLFTVEGVQRLCRIIS